MSLYLLRPSHGGSTRPHVTDFTEKLACEACQVVRHVVRSAPPLYEVTISNRPPWPGLYATNQPRRATLIHESLLAALRERDLDTGLEVLPARIRNYKSAYFVLVPRLRLLLNLSRAVGPVAPCEACGGYAWALQPDAPLFHPPSEALHWYDTNVIREPSVILAVSEEVRSFLTSAKGEALLRPSKILGLPSFVELEV